MKDKLKIGISIFVIAGLSACSGSNTACKCIEEFDTMNYNSALYMECIDWAIAEGADDAYKFFKKECDK